MFVVVVELVNFPEGMIVGTGLLADVIWMVMVEVKVEVTLMKRRFKARNRKRL